MSLTIFVELNEAEQYQLMCADGMMSPAPCGPRILRGPPHPDVRFSHPTIDAAEADARKLRAYLAGLSTKKVSKKRTAMDAA